ncbi:hypothetical protein B0H11DRAFT_1932179 [Mycena galericulata]|nr:hypothetical protein B0H11DRAFT_1932179 [Mycena galericulata]
MAPPNLTSNLDLTAKVEVILASCCRTAGMPAERPSWYLSAYYLGPGFGNCGHHMRIPAGPNLPVLWRYNIFGTNPSTAVNGRTLTGRTAKMPSRTRPSIFIRRVVDGTGRPAVDGTRRTRKNGDGNEARAVCAKWNSSADVARLTWDEDVVHRGKSNAIEKTIQQTAVNDRGNTLPAEQNEVATPRRSSRAPRPSTLIKALLRGDAVPSAARMTR